MFGTIVSLSYFLLTYANVMKSHLITPGVTQLRAHCVHYPVRLHRQNPRVQVTGDLMSPLLWSRAWILSEAATGKIRSGNSNFLLAICEQLKHDHWNVMATHQKMLWFGDEGINIVHSFQLILSCKLFFGWHYNRLGINVSLVANLSSCVRVNHT